jgi:anti-anti-sigma regulatory factor
MTATIRSSAAGAEPAAPAFLLSIDLTDGSVAVHGDLDREHVGCFLETVGLLTSSEAPCWSIDVSAVTFCDAGGLRGLLEAKRCADRAHRAFRVAGAGPWIRLLLPMIGLDAVADPAPIPRAVR